MELRGYSQREKMLPVVVLGAFVSDQIVWLQLKLLGRPLHALFSLLVTHPWDTHAGLPNSPQINTLIC